MYSNMPNHLSSLQGLSLKLQFTIYPDSSVEYGWPVVANDLGKSICRESSRLVTGKKSMFRHPLFP
jgi:hypothetical protein